MTTLNTNINLHWRKSLPEQSDPLNYPKCAKHVIEENVQNLTSKSECHKSCYL